MSVEVSLNTPLADALSNIVQPKLTEIGWNTGGLDDSALGEYIILMLVNGKTQDQIATELSNDLLSLGPDDTGAIDFSKWLFEQVHLLNAQINGSTAPQTQQVPQGQGGSSHQIEGEQGHSENSQPSAARAPDADMGEAMDDVQDGSIPTGPKSMRSGSRTGNKRLMGQLSKAMDRSSDAILHRVRPQQGTERINMHNRQPPKGPRNDQNRNQRVPPNLRAMGAPNGGTPNGGMPTPMMNATPQQQMALFAMLEEQARMMSQIFSPQQQNFMPGMPQPAINPNFRPGGQAQNQQPDRSLFERIEHPAQQQNGHSNKRQQYDKKDFQSRNHHSTAPGADGGQESANGDVTSSMEVESSQKSQSEQSSGTVCKFNLKCTKADCPYAHQSPAAPPGITLDLSSGCPFGARCQNRKCIMRHPSPAQNPAHSTAENCRFFPNCTNPTCPFRHPVSTPLCRFGESCTREGCKFKHVTITCKFNPCLNPECPYKHTENQQRGTFGDKVWRADGDQEKEHVSERKFVNDNMAEEVPLVRRTYATSKFHAEVQSEATNVAVLGGGITGLASAYYLAQQLPHSHITLFEGSLRLGGWLRSKQVDVGNGKVVFEQGPRNLRPTRPNGWVTLDLVQSLGLEDQVLMTSKESVAAQNRFIYYPDHLVRLPGPGVSLLTSIVTILREPLFKDLFSASLTEPFKSAQRGMDDESIGSFISRRFKPALADNIISAIIHGIYAGDIYQLSVRSIFPILWYAEKEVKSVTAAVGKGLTLRWPQDVSLKAEWAKAAPVTGKIKAVRDSSVFTFKRGIGQLADRLVSRLQEFPNVNIRLGTTVDGLQRQSDGGSHKIGLMIRPDFNKTDKPITAEFTHVISTISSKALSSIVVPVSSVHMLSQTPSVTVMVVNLCFSNPSILPARGFGYLLPRSLPFEQNPEYALGVVFDSDATIGQDEVPGTKVTVMLGGHWWDGWVAYPDEDMGASMARAVLKRHLGISEEPQAIHVGLQKDCIPQYTVGHHSRMARADGELWRQFNGRLKVAGNSYTGVGLNDCIRSARNVVASLVEGRIQDTGLESFMVGNGPHLRKTKGSEED
ncbi:MAG: hypothetical protein Q9188_001334 [Gyalolechia gomerana]